MTLRIDLSTGDTEVTPDGDWLFGIRELAGTPPRLPVYHPAQPIVFRPGRAALALTRFTLYAKSPLSNGVAESRVEGPFGPALAEPVVLTGHAPRPCYVLIADGRTQVLDATDLWGLDTQVTTDKLVARHGPDAQVATIGPAGENLVRFASLVTSGGYPAARMGAVFGAKRCKAVVVIGSVPGSDYLVDAYRALIPTNPLTLSQHTPPGFGTWPSAELEGYFSATGFDPREFMSHLTRSTGGCPGCPQDCMKSFDGTPLHQQAVAAFTGLGIHDLSTVLALNTRCVRWGVDPVSLAGVLAYRCSVPGGPSFGDVPALLALASDVVSRRSVLAEGVARASRVLGGEEHAMHCKGIELPVFDPRGNQGLALSFAVHPLGPRYDGVEHDIDFDPVWGQPQFVRNAGLPSPLPMDSLTDTKVDLVADLMELWSGYDAVGVCLFAAPPTRNLTEATAADLVSAVTGRTVTPSDIRSLGRQRLQLMLDYNLREGLTPADDTLPNRFFTEPVGSGRLAGAVLDRTTFTEAVARLRELLGFDD